MEQNLQFTQFTPPYLREFFQTCLEELRATTCKGNCNHSTNKVKSQRDERR